MKFITFSQLEDLEMCENVEKIELNGISSRDGESYYYTIYYVDGREEDIYIIRNLDGLEWAAVKHKLENYITVDKDNIDDNGYCIVDFTGKYGDYSISGKIINDELIINDTEQIYMNH